MKIVPSIDAHANYTTMAVCHDNEQNASRDTILVRCAIQQRVGYCVVALTIMSDIRCYRSQWPTDDGAAFIEAWAFKNLKGLKIEGHSTIISVIVYYNANAILQVISQNQPFKLFFSNFIQMQLQPIPFS